MTAIDNYPEVGQYIGGVFGTGGGTRTQPVYNRATGTISRHVRLSNPQDVQAAVACAGAAFPAWADVPPIRRARALFKFLELLNRQKTELAGASYIASSRVAGVVARPLTGRPCCTPTCCARQAIRPRYSHASSGEYGGRR